MMHSGDTIEQLTKMVEIIQDSAVEIIETEHDGDGIPYAGEPEDEFERRTR